MQTRTESSGSTGSSKPYPFITATAFALSAVVGVIHLAVVPEHWAEFRLYGVAFVAMAAFQIGWAATMAREVSRTGFLVGLAVNTGLIGLWAISRTVALPLGPDGGHVEAVGLLDSVATAGEAAIVMVALLALSKRPLLPATADRGI